MISLSGSCEVPLEPNADLVLVVARSGKKGSFGAAATVQDDEITVQYLDTYAETQWEVRPVPSLQPGSFSRLIRLVLAQTIQHFMVGSESGAKKHGDKGERRCVSSPRRAGPLRARMQVRRLYKGPVELTRATLRADT